MFTIFYSFIFLVSFLLEFCQKSFLLCVFFEWSIFRLNLVVAAYSFGEFTVSYQVDPGMNTVFPLIAHIWSVYY